MSIFIRPASTEDCELIAFHRKAMFEDMGEAQPQYSEQARREFAAWLQPRIASGEYTGLLACEGERVLAGLGIWWIEWPPGPGAVQDGITLRAYIMNVYTFPEYRGRGLASSLMRAALDACRQRGVRRITLHASDQGRPIYEGFGFSATNEMKLRFDEG